VKDQAAPVPAQRPGRSSRPPGTSLDQLPLAGKSVLIIEDEALIAVGLETCLQNAGAIVKIVNSIASAQSALHSMRPLSI
jgi:hypothetical protein